MLEGRAEWRIKHWGCGKDSWKVKWEWHRSVSSVSTKMKLVLVSEAVYSQPLNPAMMSSLRDKDCPVSAAMATATHPLHMPHLYHRCMSSPALPTGSWWKTGTSNHSSFSLPRFFSFKKGSFLWELCWFGVICPGRNIWFSTNNLHVPHLYQHFFLSFKQWAFHIPPL